MLLLCELDISGVCVCGVLVYIYISIDAITIIRDRLCCDAGSPLKRDVAFSTTAVRTQSSALGCLCCWMESLSLSHRQASTHNDKHDSFDTEMRPFVYSAMAAAGRRGGSERTTRSIKISFVVVFFLFSPPSKKPKTTKDLTIKASTLSLFPIYRCVCVYLSFPWLYIYIYSNIYPVYIVPYIYSFLSRKKYKRKSRKTLIFSLFSRRRRRRVCFRSITSRSLLDLISLIAKLAADSPSLPFSPLSSPFPFRNIFKSIQRTI
jgi:hypothetical protein